MPLSFTYMGTKRRIAAQVAEVIAGTRSGPMLDLFAGVSAVGSAVAPKRNVWCNDVQHFAHTLGTSIFSSRQAPRYTPAVLQEARTLASENRKKLLASHLGELAQGETDILEHSKFKQGAGFFQKLIELCESDRFARTRDLHRHSCISRPYRLFSITYAGGYIGINQAIEIDSLRYAVDTLLREGTIDAEQHRWGLLALCKALAKVTNSTGHFAQYLAFKESTYARLLAQRRRRIYSEWSNALEQMAPEGTASWRKRNRTFRSDAVQLLQKLTHSRALPAVVYADPPYTADHYSRYYHLLDTLLLYDYPEPTGKGQYRHDRFTSDFSLRSKVYSAFHELAAGTANLGCDLVINYPAAGLLDDPKDALLGILRQYFRKASVARVISHQHSSLGASKGREKSPVTELVLYAQ